MAYKYGSRGANKGQGVQVITLKEVLYRTGQILNNI